MTKTAKINIFDLFFSTFENVFFSEKWSFPDLKISWASRWTENYPKKFPGGSCTEKKYNFSRACKELQKHFIRKIFFNFHKIFFFFSGNMYFKKYFFIDQSGDGKTDLNKRLGYWTVQIFFFFWIHCLELYQNFHQKFYLK